MKVSLNPRSNGFAAQSEPTIEVGMMPSLYVHERPGASDHTILGIVRKSDYPGRAVRGKQILHSPFLEELIFSRLSSVFVLGYEYEEVR